MIGKEDKLEDTSVTAGNRISRSTLHRIKVSLVMDIVETVIIKFLLTNMMTRDEEMN